MALRIFLNGWFQRFVRKERIPESVLIEAIRRAERGLVDADLGNGIIKQRIARFGSGKSGGYRTIVFFRTNERGIFAFGFAKNRRDNMTPDDERILKAAARIALGLSNEDIDRLVQSGDLKELKDND